MVVLAFLVYEEQDGEVNQGSFEAWAQGLIC